MTTPASPDHPEQQAQDPAARLEELRNETAELESQLGVGPRKPMDDVWGAPASAGPPVAAQSAKGGGWWRIPIATLCLILVAVLAPLSIVATWAHDEISDTDRYVSTVGPLAHDPAVQSAISTRVTDELVARLNITAVTQAATNALAQRGLPPRVATSLKALDTPLANAVEGFIGNQVTRVVQSPAFADAWDSMNRTAHEQMVAVLTGKGSNAVSVQGDAVTLNLGPVIDQVKAQLAASGFALANRVPQINAEFTLFQSSDITKAQTGFRLLKALARALPWVVLVLIAIAVAVARHRRRTLIVGSLVVAGSMLALGLLLNGFRAVYLDAVPSDRLPSDAAAAIYDQLVMFIRLALRAVLVVFLAIALVAWVTGPGPAPVAIRRGTTRAIDLVRHRADRAGLDTGPVGAFLGRYRSAIRVGVIGLVALLYVLAAHPTGAYALTLLLVGGLILLIVELLARPPAKEGSAPPPDEARSDAP
jgi:hypothetical protein